MNLDMNKECVFRSGKRSCIQSPTAFLVLFIFSLFMVAASPTPAIAATYYVDATSGNDSNPGTTETLPWKTLTKAANTAQAGDTVLVRDGTSA